MKKYLIDSLKVKPKIPIYHYHLEIVFVSGLRRIFEYDINPIENIYIHPNYEPILKSQEFIRLYPLRRIKQISITEHKEPKKCQATNQKVIFRITFT